MSRTLWNVPLVKALGDPLNGVRDAAAVALKKLNEPLGERIYENLKGFSKAWEELARLNDPRAIAPLVKALGAGTGTCAPMRRGPSGSSETNGPSNR